MTFPPPPPPPMPGQIPPRRSGSPLAAILIVGGIGAILIAALIVVAGILVFTWREDARRAPATVVEAMPAPRSDPSPEPAPAPAPEPTPQPQPQPTPVPVEATPSPPAPGRTTPRERPPSPARTTRREAPRPGGVVGNHLGEAPPVPPPPPPSRPIRVGGQIPQPTKLRDVRPVYPPIAISARVQGVVIIEATIGTDGKVTDAKVLRSIPLLDQAALEAVRQWEYTPTLLNGEPVPVIMTVTCNFTLQ